MKMELLKRCLSNNTSDEESYSCVPVRSIKRSRLLTAEEEQRDQVSLKEVFPKINPIYVVEKSEAKSTLSNCQELEISYSSEDSRKDSLHDSDKDDVKKSKKPSLSDTMTNSFMKIDLKDNKEVGSTKAPLASNLEDALELLGKLLKERNDDSQASITSDNKSETAMDQDMSITVIEKRQVIEVTSGHGSRSSEDISNQSSQGSSRATLYNETTTNLANCETFEEGEIIETDNVINNMNSNYNNSSDFTESSDDEEDYFRGAFVCPHCGNYHYQEEYSDN